MMRKICRNSVGISEYQITQQNLPEVLVESLLASAKFLYCAGSQTLNSENLYFTIFPQHLSSFPEVV